MRGILDNLSRQCKRQSSSAATRMATATKGPAPSGTRLTIRLPDDFHHHSRDGPKTAAVLVHATKRFGRCLMMPNIKPPVTTTAKALNYRDHIQASMPKDKEYPHFQPLMTLYLTDKTTAEEIKLASQAGIVGCKYYPAGATTNSDYGVTDIKNCHGALKEMAECGMMLAIHSEVTHADIFEREPVFIEEVIKPLVATFPNLKITMEHISTKEAVDYVLSAPDNVKASITVHHLLYNRNRVFSAHAAVELYTEAFDQVGALDKLEDFCSSYGADHYGLPRNTVAITLEKKSWKVPSSFDFGDGKMVTPLRANEEVLWSIVEG
eukprot:scaffold429_cov169-Amphora_coffeaeformis.AAC.2